MSDSMIFDAVDTFPNEDRRKQFDALVGLDDKKAQIVKEASIILDHSLLEKWSKEKHGEVIGAVQYFHNRPPLFIFEGDVGTGKTTLAESFGAEVAAREKMEIKLFRLSLKTRGTGRVGQISGLITESFDDFMRQIGTSPKGKRHHTCGILLIDEADALAQSRELDQMHHEDRTGVNALIQGIDRIANGNVPALVVMCTNRVGAIDPAVQRRAAGIFTFMRPNEEQRLSIIEKGLTGTKITQKDLQALAKAMGPTDERKYGYTFSDLTQRFLPGVVLDAYPDKPITIESAMAFLQKTLPTKPFASESA